MSDRPKNPESIQGAVVSGTATTVLDETLRELANAIWRSRDLTEDEAREVLSEALEPSIKGAFPLHLIKIADPAKYEDIFKDILGGAIVLVNFYIHETTNDPHIAKIVQSFIRSEAERFINLIPENLRLQGDITKITLDFRFDPPLVLFGLPTDFARLLAKRLSDEGLSEADAAKVARTAVADFQAKAKNPIQIENSDQIEAAIELIVAGVRATESLAAKFDQAALPTLPPKAPEVWAERDRSKGETPISFLNRVWEPWLATGVLYQDDIKRLGDPKLVPAIRTYCQRHPDIKAANVLPPPQRQRIDDALAAAQPGSIEEQLLRNRIHHRGVVRHSKARSRKPH